MALAAGSKVTSLGVHVYADDTTLAELPLSVPPQPIALKVSVLLAEGLEVASYVVLPLLHVPSASQAGSVPSFVKQTLVEPVDANVSSVFAVMALAAGSKVTSLGVHVYADDTTLAELPLSVPPQPIALKVSVLLAEGLEVASYVVLPLLHVP